MSVTFEHGELPHLLEENKPGILIHEVNRILREAGLVKQADYFIQEPIIAVAINLPDEYQKLNLNRFFNLQLMKLDVSTINQRYCLLNVGNSYAWLKSFVDGVLPTLMDHQLPKA